MTGADRALRYAEQRAGVAARQVALSYWSFDVRALPSPDFVHRVWPDGCCSLVIALLHGRVIVHRVQGTIREPLDVPVVPGMQYRGIRFRPEMGARWLRRPAATLPGYSDDAFAVFGDALAPLLGAITAAPDDARCAATFDAWIAERVEAEPALGDSDLLVRRAVDLLIDSEGQCRIAEIAAALDVQPRTLQRRFVQSVGLTPKAFALIRRTRAMLRRAVADGGTARMGWSGLAAETGFADQAHLTRDVGRMTRFSPERLRERLDTIAHEGLVD